LARKSIPEIDQKFKSEIHKKYLPIPTAEDEKLSDGIFQFITFAKDEKKTIKMILDQVARTIFRLFGFKEIAIIMKDQRDGMYRYMSMVGFRKEAEEAHKLIAYTEEEVTTASNFPFIKVGRISEFHPAEYTSEEESIAERYNRPILLSVERETNDSFLEGDYFDIDIRDARDKLLGWIEIANTANIKFPSRNTLMCIETIASILGMLIEKRF